MLEVDCCRGLIREGMRILEFYLLESILESVKGTLTEKKYPQNRSASCSIKYPNTAQGDSPMLILTRIYGNEEGSGGRPGGEKRGFPGACVCRQLFSRAEPAGCRCA
ncbi:hypothetical protein NECAME_04496 [Necator americanus]|uniref:Uncharacterized protein n=1 Tax=Necator americanus TaxID=51031 RepID=W2SUF2_NECAM|nr:hypothetical protein NECAME_04496 [Necator americanus]ETN72317.1 hypothetical protein NECAME_04496 [Necator americanus]